MHIRPLRIAAVLLCFASLGWAGAKYVWGPEPSHTGAPAVASHPAEELCDECHLLLDENNAPLPNTNLACGRLELLDVPAEFYPGHTYTLRLRLACDSTAAWPDRKWGFEVTAVNAIDGEPAGQFDAAARVGQQVVTGFEPGWEGRSYIEHVEAGTQTGAASPVEWSIDWIAPAGAVDKVYFFAAGVAANGAYDTVGDYVFTTSDSANTIALATRRTSWGALKNRFR